VRDGGMDEKMSGDGDMKEKQLRTDPLQREIPLHIHSGFPIGILLSSFPENLYDFVGWHWHEEIQYNVVMEGSFCFRVAGKEYHVEAGDGLFINTQHSHMAQATTPGSSYLFVYFHPSLLTDQKDGYFYRTHIAPLLSDASARSLLLEKRDDADRQAIDIILGLKEIYDAGADGYELDLLSGLIQLWKQTIRIARARGLTGSGGDPLADDRLKKILSFIEEHYSEAISLDMVAGHAGLSRSECSRFFKQSTGTNLFQYLMHFRVGKSVELLADTEKSIANIAYGVGFNSQSYYTKCFVAINKQTPNEVRGLLKNSGALKQYLQSVELS